MPVGVRESPARHPRAARAAPLLHARRDRTACGQHARGSPAQLRGALHRVPGSRPLPRETPRRPGSCAGAVVLAEAVRAGQQFGRRQPAAGPPRAPPAPRGSGRPLRRHPSASDHAVAPAGGALLRRRAPRAPGTTAASRFWRSAPSSGRRSSPTRWWRPTTGSLAERIAKPRAPANRSLATRRPRSREALRAFAELGRALIGARETGEALDAVIADRPGWVGLEDLVARAAALASTAASDPLDHVGEATAASRRYTPRMAAHARHRGVTRGPALAGSR